MPISVRIIGFTQEEPDPILVNPEVIQEPEYIPKPKPRLIDNAALDELSDQPPELMLRQPPRYVNGGNVAQWVICPHCDRLCETAKDRFKCRKCRGNGQTKECKVNRSLVGPYIKDSNHARLCYIEAYDRAFFGLHAQFPPYT